MFRKSLNKIQGEYDASQDKIKNLQAEMAHENYEPSQFPIDLAKMFSSDTKFFFLLDNYDYLFEQDLIDYHSRLLEDEKCSKDFIKKLTFNHKLMRNIEF